MEKRKIAENPDKGAKDLLGVFMLKHKVHYLEVQSVIDHSDYGDVNIKSA